MRSFLAMAVLGLLVGCGHNHTDDAGCIETTAISITDYKFSPTCVTVTGGSTVTFTNNGATSHTSSTDAGQSQTWDSETIAPHGTFDIAITGSGDVKGHCSFHPDMHFTVQVQ